MPELAEAEYYRKQWSVSEGRRVERVQLHEEKRVFRGTDTEALARGLSGARLARSGTCGKLIYFVFGERHWLGVHLGMTGKLFQERRGFHRHAHDHLVLRMEEGPDLVFSDPRLFGRVRYAEGESVPDWISGLPPEILSSEFTEEKLNRFLDRRSKSPIKAVLLMQERFPGIGNWMADEVLWRSRIRPEVAAGGIGPRKRVELYDTLKEVCSDALRVIGTDWSDPPGRAPRVVKILRWFPCRRA